MDLLMAIASNSSETDASEWNVIVLEILYNTLRNVSPKDVFTGDTADDVSNICLFFWGGDGWMRRKSLRRDNISIIETYHYNVHISLLRMMVRIYFRINQPIYYEKKVE